MKKVIKSNEQIDVEIQAVFEGRKRQESQKVQKIRALRVCFYNYFLILFKLYSINHVLFICLYACVYNRHSEPLMDWKYM